LLSVLLLLLLLLSVLLLLLLSMLLLLLSVLLLLAWVIATRFLTIPACSWATLLPVLLLLLLLLLLLVAKESWCPVRLLLLRRVRGLCRHREHTLGAVGA
jgi:hypothetical protein